MYLQQTLRQRARVEGIGLHTGQPASLTFCPAPAHSGIYFVRRGRSERLPVRAELVTATSLATTLGQGDFTVSTVEHCLSTLSALRLDNVIIELDGAEIPICDGSARDFLNAILAAGTVEQDHPRKYAYISEPIYCGDDHKHAYVVPYHGLKITCTIDFPHPKIGRQTLEVDIHQGSFVREIAGARTFGFLKDVEAMRARGLALGGSLANAIVMDDQDILNPEGLRYADEFVRHKILDALGDLVTLGMPLMGHLVLFKAGHDLMNQLVRKILSSPGSYRHVELGGEYSLLALGVGSR